MSGKPYCSTLNSTTLTNGSACPQNKRQGCKQPPRKVPVSSPRNQHKDNNGKDSNEPSTNRVLGSQKALGPSINSFVDFGKAAGCGLIVGAGDETGRIRYALGTDGDTGYDYKLEKGPGHGHEGRCDDDGGCRCLIIHRGNKREG